MPVTTSTCTKSAANCHLSKCLPHPFWRSWLNLRRCRIRHKRTRHERITPPSCPTLNPATGHDIHSFNVTCMSEEERPGSGRCSTHRPCSRACSLGSAWFCSACPSGQLAALIKAESSAPPPAPWHQSGLAVHKAPLQTLLMLAMQTRTALHGHERSLVPPTPSHSACPAQCCCGAACLLQHR